MAKLFDIQDTTVVITNLTLSETQGSVSHTGDVDIAGNLAVDHNLVVTGTITANTFNVENLITANGSLASVGNWTYNTESELIGKGFSWTFGTGSTQLLYRDGGRIWNSGNYDTAATSSYNIDNIPVLTATALGPTITSSNLTKIGTLQSLEVSGDATISDFAYFNSTYNRMGIGTEEPNGALSILDNNVELVFGSPATNVGAIGTHSNHDLQITTDALARITIKHSGEVNIGDPVNGGGVLNVYGTLFASSIQTDNRINRTHPLEFNATPETSIYGLGMIWTGTGNNRSLIMMAGPDRLWSSESLDLNDGQGYHIGGKVVLDGTSLGSSIVNSNLITVGTLQTLNVDGVSNFMGNINAVGIEFNDGTNSLTINKSSITTNSSFTIAGQNNFLYGDKNQISIGDSSANTLPVKVFGRLSVGINNPDPSLNFAVNGDVSLGGKRFTKGTAAPIDGIFNVSDICWNTMPQLNSPVGWICITAGTPGQWAPFGMIG